MVTLPKGPTGLNPDDPLDGHDEPGAVRRAHTYPYPVHNTKE